ncbi:hypothetical protein MFMK1_000013 [Metallumcola ferriviriculae]|uniref:Uncharacterized protein n=1 Tax=Metallumcola ferriviriculae TaxID=3039180 RepID=A0AAU0UJD0_9FIRM|nr:hypothetical protein MFMK1_000013 [Desulfitibacteraceae bacterium MK1]
MWEGWPIARVILLFLAVVFIAIFVQVTMFHYRQNFRHWAQWLPVLGAPLLGLVSLLLVFYVTPLLILSAGIFYAVGALAGLTGLTLHTTGVGERVGGYNLENFLVGPPVILPMMVLSMSVLGLIALYWR